MLVMVGDDDEPDSEPRAGFREVKEGDELRLRNWSESIRAEQTRERRRMRVLAILRAQLDSVYGGTEAEIVEAMKDDPKSTEARIRDAIYNLADRGLIERIGHTYRITGAGVDALVEYQNALREESI